MKKLSIAAFVLTVGLLFQGPALSAQLPDAPKGDLMLYEIVNGDTVYMDILLPARISRRGSRKQRKSDFRKYAKLVYNFNKIYPYALVGRKMMAQVDSTLSADVTKASQRTSYINDVERELFRLFEDDIWHMTVSQGFLLLKLVDRECGLSGYEIIQTYESNFAAGFWQLVAKLFSQNLKQKYNPKGDDFEIEELVNIWDSGGWDVFYLSIFGDYPTKTVISTDVLSSEVRKKKK